MDTGTSMMVRAKQRYRCLTNMENLGKKSRKSILMSVGMVGNIMEVENEEDHQTH